MQSCKVSLPGSCGDLLHLLVLVIGLPGKPIQLKEIGVISAESIPAYLVRFLLSVLEYVCLEIPSVVGRTTRGVHRPI